MESVGWYNLPEDVFGELSRTYRDLLSRDYIAAIRTLRITDLAFVPISDASCVVIAGSLLNACVRCAVNTSDKTAGGRAAFAGVMLMEFMVFPDYWWLVHTSAKTLLREPALMPLSEVWDRLSLIDPLLAGHVAAVMDSMHRCIIAKCVLARI